MEENGDWLPALVEAPIPPDGNAGRVPVPVFRTPLVMRPEKGDRHPARLVFSQFDGR